MKNKNVVRYLLLLLVLLFCITFVSNVAEARSSFGRQIEQTLRRNAVNFVDRTLRAHTDNWVSDIYFWHRVHRNERLRKFRERVSSQSNRRNTLNVYNYTFEVNSNGRRYAVGGFQTTRELDQFEKSGMQKIASALSTGEPIRASGNYERRRIIEMSHDAGLIVRTNGFLVYVSAP